MSHVCESNGVSGRLVVRSQRDDVRAHRHSPTCVLVFTRPPEPGRVKTRLIPTLGAEGAAAMHRALVERTLAVVREYGRAADAGSVIRVAGEPNALPISILDESQRIMPQQGDGLGERLVHAFHAAFAEGARRVMAIGTDCPELSAGRLAEAGAALERADVIIGPALDGGYYLVGMKQHQPELFQEIAWGTERVLRQTCARAKQLGLRVRLLPALSDIDEPEDLVVWRRLGGTIPSHASVPRAGLISVVIPTLNEASRLPATLRPLVNRDDLEVIVADGGSTDATVAIARDHGARVIATRAGRARQMNAGAAVALGDRLLFLHADTTLPDGFAEVVHTTLDRGSIAGAFRLSIDGDSPWLRWVERGANLRSRFLQLPYGDQALFMNAATFYSAGGFRNMPLMEDYELCRRLRRTGCVTLASLAVSTSARRWLALGITRTTLVNQLCIAGFLVGVPPAVLARLYTGTRRDDTGIGVGIKTRSRPPTRCGHS
jgi:rSAM/selenodomain-associated transferase 2/rSAM/selenodomain-associated transferase 1